MTTESKQVSTVPGLGTGLGTLLGAASLAFGAGAVVALVALAADGRGAAYAALGLAVATAAVMALGAGFVNLVAAVMPAASLLLALLTYAFQLAVLTVVLVVVARASDPAVTGWAAGAMIAATLVWTLGHVVIATRRRIPVYDLPARDQIRSASDGVRDGSGAGAR